MPSLLPASRPKKRSKCTLCQLSRGGQSQWPAYRLSRCGRWLAACGRLRVSGMESRSQQACADQRDQSDAPSALGSPPLCFSVESSGCRRISACTPLSLHSARALSQHQNPARHRRPEANLETAVSRLRCSLAGFPVPGIKPTMGEQSQHYPVLHPVTSEATIPGNANKATS
jgi:hypothetical protein